MRIALLLPGLLLFTVATAAGPVTPKTTEVTVYRSGAKVTSMATVSLPAGVSEVVFENLSPYFDGNSLQVKIKGNARLNAAVFQLKSPGPAPENPRAQILRDSLVFLGDDLLRFSNEREVLQEEATLIRNNQNRVSTSGEGNKTTLTVDELQALATYYRQRLLEIKERTRQLDIQLRERNKVMEQMTVELTKLHPNIANETGEIVLKLDASAAQSVEIACSYLVQGAGWTPLYDLRSAGVDQPLTLVYKANVRNETGFDWKRVQLRLSTAQPLANNNRPILNPVFVDFRPVAVAQQKDQALQEVVVTSHQMAQINIRGSRSNATNYYIDGIRVDGTVPPVEDIGYNDFSADFDVSAPQDILSDGEENIVTINEQEIPAIYEYHAVPKLNAAVFLLAKVTDYGQYNLLPGTANIFFTDTYIGKTWVDPGTTSDTLLLSLGRDEQITVKRVQPKDFKERRKIFNSRIRETFEYEIILKNNKTIPVTVDLLDQLPIARQEDIKVTLEERDGARYDAEFGKLEWLEEVLPGKSKKVRFRYTVEYPKDKPIGYFRG